MVATLVTLKLRLLRNTLLRETWRIVFLIIGCLYGIGVLALLLIGSFAAQVLPLADRQLLLTGAGALLFLGWALVPLVTFGVDDSLDPARFMLFTAPTPRFAVGLVLAGAMTLPAWITALALLLITPIWADGGAAALLLGLLGSVLGLATCLLLARVTTTAAAAQLSSRRGRDAVAVLGTVLFLIPALFIGIEKRVSLAGVGDSLSPLLTTVAWTPLGAPFAMAGDAASGSWGVALARLGIGLGTIALLWFGWYRLVVVVMSGHRQVTTGRRSRDRGDYLLPSSLRLLLRLDTPSAAVAARCLRYWRTDPRYLASLLASVLIVVVLGFVFAGLIDGAGLAGLLVLPVMFAALAGWGLHNDVAFDSTALHLHIVSGTRGSSDRLGRTVAALAWMMPALVVLSLAATLLAGRIEQLPTVLGAGLGVLGSGLGVSALASGLLVYPGQPPGSSPFSSGSTGAVGLTLVAQSVSGIATIVLALPVITTAILALVLSPPWAWVTLVLGALLGTGWCALGVVQGGRALDTRAPRHLQTIRGWAGH